MNTILIVLPILTLLMFDLGLTLTLDDFRMFVHRPRPIIAGLAGQILFLPLLAAFIGLLFSLPPLYFIGIMLIACSPGGSSSNVFSMLAKGDVALSVSLTACSSVITLLTVPFIMDMVARTAGTAVGVHLPVGNLLVQNLLLMALPIAAGLTLAAKKKQIAEKIHNILKRIAFPALILLASVFFVQHKETIIRTFPSLGACITLLILLSMSAGSILSHMFRLNGREKRTIVIEVGMQNAAQAIAVACSPLVFNDERIAIPAVIYALMMNVVLLTYVWYYQRVVK